MVALSADNTNCNFGGARHLGKSNTFVKLQSCLNRNDLLGLGCNTHMLHNAMQTTSDCLPVDVQQIVFTIYQYFSIYNVCVESLKQFCEFVEVECKKVLGYSNAHWLALRPAVERILQIEGLRSYFMS